MNKLVVLIALIRPPAQPYAHPTFQLPPYECSQAFCNLAREHLYAAKAWYGVAPYHVRAEVEDEIRERELLLECWEAASMCRQPHVWYYGPDPTETLCRLIGPAAYGAGEMPPPVPFWRYRPVD